MRTNRRRRVGAFVGRGGEAAGKLICKRPFAALGLVAVVAASALTIQVSNVEQELMRAAALRNAAQHANALAHARDIYAAEIGRRSTEVDVPTSEALLARLGERMSQGSAGGEVRIYNPYRLGGKPPDAFLYAAWERVAADPTEPFFRYATVSGRPSVRYARALFVQDDCQSCSDLGLTKGDVAAVLEVVRPLDGAVVMARSAAWHTFVLTFAVTTAALALVGFLVVRLRSNSDSAVALAEERRHANKELEREIAQRARAEQALESANDRLTANHATLERWAAELEIAHVRLRELDDLKTKFLSEVSHELRSPMAAIVSAAKIINKHHRAKPEVVERFGSTIVSEGARMTRLINDFLDLTKVEAGCVDWHDEEIEVGELLADVVHGLESLAMEGGIELRSRADAGLPTLHADRDRLFQVVTNLTGNALKFTPADGSVTIIATAEQGDIMFSVEDTGPGISAEELPKVFDRFHQVRSAKAEGSRKGTGLGLCISREIVEHYGGRIWVESELGTGSAFCFTIPACATRARDEAAAAGAGDARRVGAQAVRVLVMLESQERAARAVSVPAAQGIECRACADVVEMESIAASWRPDVLVVSSSLADDGGHDTLRRGHELGIARILVHSEVHGLTSPAVLDSAELLVPSLRGLIAQGSLVLVAEDDDKYRSILEFELKQAGYEVATARSGREAIAAVDARRPDAMILDLIMPDVDGLMVLEHFAGRPLDFPVLVYTAMDDPSVALAAKELGATEVFRKDASGQVSYAAVAAHVRRVLTPVLAPAEHAYALT